MFLINKISNINLLLAYIRKQNLFCVYNNRIIRFRLKLSFIFENFRNNSYY